MNKNYSLSAFLLVILFIGCSQRGKEGVYIGAEGSYIEIKADGSFFAKNISINDGSFEAEDNPRAGGRKQVVGKYQWEEGGIIFIFEGGQAVRARIASDTLTVGYGSGDQIWIRWQGGKSGLEYEQSQKDQKKYVN